MKKTFLARMLAVFMVLVMLSASCFSVAASIGVKAPGNTTDNNDNYYSVTLENGVLSIRVNPDKIYAVLQDGDLTKDELLQFIPADILDTLSKGKDLTLDDIEALVARYVTKEDLKELVDLLPVDVIREYFSFDMLADIITFNEMMSLIPVDEIMAEVDKDQLNALLTDEVMNLILNQNMKDAVLTDSFIDDIVNNTTLVDDVLADPVIKQNLINLVDADIINALMNDSVIGPKLEALATSEEVMNRVLGDAVAVKLLENYITDPANAAKLDAFIADTVVADAITKIDGIKSLLLTEDSITALVNNNVVTKDTVSQLFTQDELRGLITDDVLNKFMANTAFVNSIFADDAVVAKIATPELMSRMLSAGYITYPPTTDAVKNAVLTNPAARTMVVSYVKTESTVDYNDYWKYIDVNLFINSVGMSKIVGEIENTPSRYEKLLTLVTPSQIIDAIGKEACNTLVKDNLLDIINNVGINKILEYYDRDGIVNALGGYAAFVEKEYITVDEVANAANGFANLIGFFDTNELMNAIGMSTLVKYVNIDDVVNAAGGYSNLMSFYSNDELKAIVDTIGIDNIKQFISDSGVITPERVKEIAKNVIDFLKTKVPEIKAFIKLVIKQTLSFLVQDVDGIYIDGEKVFDAGAFDVNKIIILTLRALPNVQSFLNLKPDAIFSDYTIDTVVRGVKYTYKIQLGLLGDPTNLQNLMSDWVDNYYLDVTDNGDITLKMILPEVVSEIYAKALNSDRLPAYLKGKFVELPTMTIDDISAFAASLTDEQIAQIVDAVRDKLNAIRDKAYAFIEERVNVNELDPDSVASVKAYVDKIINAFTDPARTKVLRDKAVSALSRLPETMRTVAVNNFYTGNGNFKANGGGSVDFYNIITSFVTLPEDVKLLFKSTVLSFSLDADVTVQGMVEVELVLPDGSKYKTILPKGTSLEVLKYVDELGNIDSGFSLDNAVLATTVPDTDSTLYSNDLYTVQFVANGNVVDTVFYAKGATSITVPAIPESAKRAGYTAEWESYTLNAAKNTVVNVKYTAIEYTATFKADGRVVGTVKFTVKDTALTEPAVPAKKGYTGAWEDYTIGAGDITVNAVYTLNKYTATFKAGNVVVGTVQFTVNDTSITVPAVPAKSGYTGTWETYTLGAGDITVNAVYTPIKYNATFKADGKVVSTVQFTVENTSITAPAVPAKEGYTGKWETYALGANDIVVNAVYTPVEYTATFKVDGVVVGTVKFTVESKSITAPEIPAKVGYTGAWEAYKIEAKDITVNAIYTPVIYTATFMADGKVVGTVQFTIEDKSIAEPAVPEKEGYTGKWESYTLTNADITVNAIYTEVPVAPTSTNTWWWLLIVAVIVIAVIIFFIIKSKKNDGTPPTPPTPVEDTEPEPEPEPEAEEETVEETVEEAVEEEVAEPVVEEPIEEVKEEAAEPVVIAPVETPEKEEIDADTANELISDEDALASVIVEKAEVEAAGPREIVNIGDIDANYVEGDTVNIDNLKEKKLVSKKAGRVKVLGSGKLGIAVTVEAESFSVEAVKMIKLKGGKAIQKK